MAKVESQYILFKKGIELFFDFYPQGMDVKAKLSASGEAMTDDVLLIEIEVDQEFLKELSLDYLRGDDLRRILDGIYNEEDGKSVIQEIVCEKIDQEINGWKINIEPHIWPHPVTPERSELEYKVIMIHTPTMKFDLEELSGTDDNIRISAEIMDQIVESFNKKDLDAAFFKTYMDDVAHNPEHYE